MKSINQIFKNNPDLLQEPEVQELAEYCRELEGEVMYHKQDKQWSFEDELSLLARDIFKSVKEALQRDEEAIRFKNEGFDRIDFKEACENLNKYLQEFARRTNFNFNK